jgi:hypothetical protein
MSFKVGDKVVNEIFGEGEIVYGPYEGDLYFFKGADGLHHTVTGSYCKPAPKFHAGQKVTFRYSFTEYEIVSGPYPEEGEPFWVYKDGKGDHGIAYEMHMVPVVE